MIIGLGIGIPFIRNYISAVFNPSKLFTTGVNGVWYDPSDITRYMSSLGPELVTNGDFSNGVTGWVTANGGAVVNGRCECTTSSNFLSTTAAILTVGKWYSAEFDYFMTAGAKLRVATKDAPGPDGATSVAISQSLVTNAVTRLKITFQAAVGGFFILQASDATFSGWVDNISVRELTAATLFQDAAGTTPVTAVEQPVGLMLDKSKGLVLGSEKSSLAASTVTTTTYGAAMTGIVVGRWYLLTGTITKTGGTQVDVGVINSSYAWQAGSLTTLVVNTTITINRLFFASDTTATPAVIFTSATGSVSNFSVRELPGNHAFNSSGNSANFPVLSARYNLLTKTEQFDDAAWVKQGAAVTANVIAAPNGEVSADKLIENTANSSHEVNQIVTAGNYAIRGLVYAKAAERTKLRIDFTDLTTGDAYADFDLNTATSTSGSNGSWSGTSTSITPIANGWVLCIFTATKGGGTSVAMKVQLRDSSGSASYTGDGTSGIYIWGADLRVSNDALNQPAYQRVNTATDYDTAGFKPYLRFNGVNQWLQTNSIDFTYGDKMFVCAGVRKLSDAAVGMFVEHTTGVSGQFFHITAPNAVSGANYNFLLHGPSGAYAENKATVFTSPITDVLSCKYDLAGVNVSDQIIPRINASIPTLTPTATPATAGTGFQNAPLYIGARAGSSLWFNGRLHQLVVAGKAASASEITSCEQYLNQKTGAY